MRFLFLGPFEVWEAGRKLELGAGRQQALLLFLLLHAGERISIDRLIDALWGEQPPPTAAKIVQGWVSQLRRALPAGTIETHPSGYLLRAAETDAGEFERLLARAHREGAGEAAKTLPTALAVWRGPALAGHEYEAWAQPETARLQELRLEAVEARIEADLQLGGGGDLVAELRALVSAQPLRERLSALLML